MGGNPHIPLLLDPENRISRRHGKTQGFGMIYEQNVCFTTVPEVGAPLPPLLFFGGSPPLCGSKMLSFFADIFAPHFGIFLSPKWSQNDAEIDP